MSHVPPGVIATEKALWMYPQFNHRFNEIILEYSDIIAGLYFGHEHMDNFRISYKSGMYGYKQMWGIRQRYSNSQTTLSTMYMTRPFFPLQIWYVLQQADTGYSSKRQQLTKQL